MCNFAFYYNNLSTLWCIGVFRLPVLPICHPLDVNYHTFETDSEIQQHSKYVNMNYYLNKKHMNSII